MSRRVTERPPRCVGEKSWNSSDPLSYPIPELQRKKGIQGLICEMCLADCIPRKTGANNRPSGSSPAGGRPAWEPLEPLRSLATGGDGGGAPTKNTAPLPIGCQQSAIQPRACTQQPGLMTSQSWFSNCAAASYRRSMAPRNSLRSSACCFLLTASRCFRRTRRGTEPHFCIPETPAVARQFQLAVEVWQAARDGFESEGIRLSDQDPIPGYC